MQQAEGERDNPWVSFRQTRSPPPAVHDFGCDKHDAQRDGSLDGRHGHVDEAQRRSGQCEADGAANRSTEEEGCIEENTRRVFGYPDPAFRPSVGGIDRLSSASAEAPLRCRLPDMLNTYVTIPEDRKMRAWEFLGEDQSPPSPPVTLRSLNKLKHEMRAREKSDQERFALFPLIYGDADRRREMLELERMELEMAQLRAEIAATESEAASQSAMTITKNAKSGIAATEIRQDHITKLAKNGLGRNMKA